MEIFQVSEILVKLTSFDISLLRTLFTISKSIHHVLDKNLEGIFDSLAEVKRRKYGSESWNCSEFQGDLRDLQPRYNYYQIAKELDNIGPKILRILYNFGLKDIVGPNFLPDVPHIYGQICSRKIKTPTESLYHSSIGPSLIIIDWTVIFYFEVWTRYGVLHRLDGPAIEMRLGGQVILTAWSMDGLFHRDHQPAIECYSDPLDAPRNNFTQIYYSHGKRIMFSNDELSLCQADWKKQ